MSQNLLAQYYDVAPTGKQNILPVEGSGIVMKIDSVTPLNKLIDKLDSNWRFLETGKGYWIGYTADMFSIASRGDTAILALLNLFKTAKTKKGKTGSIYTIHLIGIKSQIVGRFYEEFTNPKARIALLELLNESEFTYSITELLMRDPWQSDVPVLFGILKSGADNEVCWPIINSLQRYGISNLPITGHVPDSLQNLNINLKVENENVLEGDFDFVAQIKEALTEYRNKYPQKIIIEDELFNENLSKYYSTMLPSNLSIGHFLMSLGIDLGSPFGYCDVGCMIQYYVENNELHFCTIGTARNRLIKWWESMSSDDRDKFK